MLKRLCSPKRKKRNRVYPRLPDEGDRYSISKVALLGHGSKTYYSFDDWWVALFIHSFSGVLYFVIGNSQSHLMDQSLHFSFIHSVVLCIALLVIRRVTLLIGACILSSIFTSLLGWQLSARVEKGCQMRKKMFFANNNNIVHDTENCGCNRFKPRHVKYLFFMQRKIIQLDSNLPMWQLMTQRYFSLFSSIIGSTERFPQCKTTKINDRFTQIKEFRYRSEYIQVLCSNQK